MRHFKLLLCVLLLSGFGLTTLQAQKMFVKEKTGLETEYSISDIKKLEFSSINLIITKSDGSSDQFLINGLSNLNFGSTIGFDSKSVEGTSVKLYPNPVAEKLNIQLISAEGHEATIEILSIAGKLVYSETMNDLRSVYQIDASTLPGGLYLCRINNGITIETVKFVKQ